MLSRCVATGSKMASTPDHGPGLHLAMPIPALYGHEGIRSRLVGAIASGRLPQALLFEGPRGVGKQRLALWLAQALVCDRAKGKAEGCGECQHCRLVLKLSHPDVHWFVPVELSKKGDRKSTRLNSSHLVISYAVFCLKKKKKAH